MRRKAQIKLVMSVNREHERRFTLIIEFITFCIYHLPNFNAVDICHVIVWSLISTFVLKCLTRLSYSKQWTHNSGTNARRWIAGQCKKNTISASYIKVSRIHNDGANTHTQTTQTDFIFRFRFQFNLFYLSLFYSHMHSGRYYYKTEFTWEIVSWIKVTC